MNYWTLLVNPFLNTLFLLVCGVLNLYGQQSDPALHFVDSLNQIITSQPAKSKAQTAASEELRARLNQLATHGSKAQRGFAVLTIQQLDYKMGTYKVLIPKQVDTISNEIVLLEKQLEKWQDSITQVQQAMKKIIEDNEQNRATREKAVFTLAGIHNIQVLDYLFKNEEKLQFTGIDPEENEALEQEMYRTAMVAIYKEYFNKESTETEKWLLMNYLLHDLKKYGFWEMALIKSILELPKPFKSPVLLLEFMYANASPGSIKTLDFLLRNKKMQKN